MFNVQRICVICVVCFICGSAPVHAQTRRKAVRAKVDSVLQSRYERVKYDTAFIGRPKARLTLKGRVNVSGNSIHARGTVNDIYSKAHLRTSRKLTLAIAANYRGLSAGLALNPASIFGKKKDYELNVNFYSNRLSLDASYHNSHTLSGDIERNGMSHLEEGYADMKVVNLAAYYTFNHRRFSYPAAFTQSYIQRRSAGSWLAGVSFQGGTIKNSESAPATLPQMRIEADNLGIGAGYGYNFVLGQKWLIHLSALPTVVVFNHNNLTINGVRKSAKAMRFNMIFNERLALVHNFSDRYFAGATAVMNNTLFDDEVVVINQNKWRFRAFFGVRIP